MIIATTYKDTPHGVRVKIVEYIHLPEWRVSTGYMEPRSKNDSAFTPRWRARTQWASR